MAGLVAGVSLLLFWRSGEAYDTQLGEQLTVALQDGTRMTLNTATRVQVKFSPAQRKVALDGGEALFEVAKDSHRPFIVQVGGTEVVAKGTAFAVRFTPTARDGDALAVTLVEGKVDVRGVSAGAQPLSMVAGDRVRLGHAGQAAAPGKPRETVTVDRPAMDQVLAWRRGEVVFDDAPLAQALAEMNRYSRTQVGLADGAELARLRVGGTFRTGDSVAFAHAVASLHGLQVRERPDGVELATRPAPG